MADFVFLSPGVFTREIDETTRPADTAGDGPVFIAPRAKGPAMQPVLLKSLDDDQLYFGAPKSDGTDFGAYVSRTFLKNATVPATFVRLLGQQGTGVTTGFAGAGANGGLFAIGSSGSTDGNVLALVYASGSVTLGGTLTSSVSSLALTVESGSATGTTDLVVTASLNRADDNYIEKVLNTDPSQFGTRNHFVYAVYDFADKVPETGVDAFYVSEVQAADTFNDDFITGSTSTVISQPFDSVEYDLFGFGSIFAGDSANTEVKVSIRDIKKSPVPDQSQFGSFTVLVRKFADSDRNPVAVETFSNCNLNPNSPNYIARRIGDRYTVWNTGTEKFDTFGDFPNRSKFVYVTPSLDLKNGNVPDAALPFGFKGYGQTLTSGSVGDKSAWPELPYVSNMLYKGTFSTKVYWGVEVINNASGAINHGVPDRLKHLPTTATAASGTVDTTFSLKFLSASTGIVAGYSRTARLSDANISAMSTSIAYSSSTTFSSGSHLTLENIENTDLAKFTLPIHNGFDGVDITKENVFDPENMGSTSNYEVHAYRTALRMISNPDEYRFTELSLPGVHHSNVTDFALEMVEDRADMFYITDISGSNVDDVLSEMVTKQYNSNYNAVYYPWVKYFDEVNNKFVFVPPTTILPAVYGYSDNVAFPWFAPAGFNRGGLRRFGVTEAKDKLNKRDRDRLYENRVNPIATFPSEGVVVWGQKTTQVTPSALDRVNVRRLLLFTRKLIARESKNLVFEPNISTTWQRFENKVNPILERIRQNSGVEDFRVILDNRTTTEDLIERNIMYGKIIIKPSRAAEFIALDFHITNNVAAFEDL